MILSLVALAAFFVYRRRKNQREGVAQTAFHPHGFDANYVENEIKAWQQHHGPVQRGDDSVPRYPGMDRMGVVEVDGVQRPVEAPAEGMEYRR